MEPLREVPLARVEVGQVELRCNPDSQAAPPGWTPCARLTWLTREHGNERNAGGLYRSRLVRAGTGAGDAHLVRSSHALNGKRARCATLAALAACKLRPKQKGVNHGPFVSFQEETKRTARCTVALRRKHQLRNLPGLQAQACSVLCALCRCAGRRARAPT